jgi:hypothetical protein
VGVSANAVPEVSVVKRWWAKQWRRGYAAGSAWRALWWKLPWMVARRCRTAEIWNRELAERNRCQHAEILRLREQLVVREPCGVGARSRTVADLDAGEVERLALLVDACAETTRAVLLVLRGGWNGVRPDGRLSYRAKLERALGDLHCVESLLYDARNVRGKEISTWRRRYREMLAETAQHQKIREERQ